MSSVKVSPANPAAVLVTDGSARGPVRKRKNHRRPWIGWIFTGPFALAFIAFLIVPLIYAFALSLQNKTLFAGTVFVGFDNYVKAFTDPLFLSGVWLVIRFCVVLIPVQMVVSLIAALVLDSLTTGFSKFARLAIFAPYAVPAVIGAIMWGFLYSRNFGPASDLAAAVGGSAPNLLSPDNVFGSLVNIVTWQWAGYYMIIIYAALKSIDPTLYESAKLDGANAFQVAMRIKIPMVSSALVLVLIFALIGTMQFFTEPQILRSVAPGSINSSFTPNIYAYTVAFAYGQFNYASAISFALGIVVFIGSFIFMMATSRKSGILK